MKNPMWSYIELPSNEPVWKWAEQHIIIPAQCPTNFPGAYRSDLAPYSRDILDMIQDPAVNTIVFEKGAQVGATMILIVGLAYWCSEDPGPALLVYPTEDIARSVSETRVMPVFDASPDLACLIPKDRKTCWTKLQYRLRKCTVNWAGSNSPANLASRAIRYAVGDEIDKWPRAVKDEADPVSLMVQRTKTYQGRRKVLLASTPTTSTGHIHRNYLAGDRRRLYLPCPHCGTKQPLVWPQVKFDASRPIDEAATGAFYECVACKKKIMDGHKSAMLQTREWRATATSQDPSTISLHLSSLYAPWVTWSQLVRKFLRAKDNPEELQDFINSELGEPFDKADVRVTDTALTNREGAYEEGQNWVTVAPYSAEPMPWSEKQAPLSEAEAEQDYVVLMWADVQKGYLEAAARVFTKDGDSGLLWSGTVSGFQALDEKAEELKATMVALDRRYRGDEVAAWVYENRHNGYIVTMGITRKHGTLFDGHALNIDEGKRTAKRVGKSRQIYELAIDPNKAKDILEKCIHGDPTVPRWMIPAGYSHNRDYVEQMTSEQRVAGKWEQIGQRANHRWDAEACLIAMAIKWGFWKWRNKKGEKSGDDNQIGAGG